MFNQFARDNPLQLLKLAFIFTTLLLACGSLFNVFSLLPFTDNLLLATNGQLAAIILIPMASINIVALVGVETLIDIYRATQSDGSLLDHALDNPGYVAVRTTEASIISLSTGGILLATKLLYTPAQSAVALSLLLISMGFGFFIVIAALSRIFVELYHYQVEDEPQALTQH